MWAYLRLVLAALIDREAQDGTAESGVLTGLCVLELERKVKTAFTSFIMRLEMGINWTEGREFGGKKIVQFHRKVLAP